MTRYLSDPLSDSDRQLIYSWLAFVRTAKHQWYPGSVELFTNGSIDWRLGATGGMDYFLNQPAVTLHNNVITLSNHELSNVLYMGEDEEDYLRNLNPTPGFIINCPRGALGNQEAWKLAAVDEYKADPSDELLERFWHTRGWVASIIGGVVTLNEKAIAKYRRDKIGREKKSAATAKDKSWRLYSMQWNTAGRIAFAHYWPNEGNGSIVLRGSSLSSAHANTAHALKHNRAEIIKALADATPNEIVTLYAESMLSGFTSAREIVEAKQ